MTGLERTFRSEVRAQTEKDLAETEGQEKVIFYSQKDPYDGSAVMPAGARPQEAGVLSHDLCYK